MRQMRHFERKRCGLLTMVVALLLAMFCMPVGAQNVTISPSSGKLIAGLTYEGEVGFQHGWNSLWRHEQLPLTLTVSDKSEITEGGVLKDPAGDISLDESQNLYVLMSGSPETTDLHIGISLPKGYRFTGYRIVLLNNLNGKSVNGFNVVGLPKTFYETDETFNLSSPKVSPVYMPGNNETREYVIERTSKTETDMGNNLYFMLDHTTRGFYGVTLKSCELYFTAEGAFQASVEPGTPAEIISEGVNMVGSPFATSKLDLGEIKPNTKSGVTYFSYDFRNVRELTASNWLYQENAVTSEKKLPSMAGTGTIQALQNENKLYYALGNNTYYIETPTETTTQDGTVVPLGYRITGAKIKYHYGSAAGQSTITYNGNLGGYYITATSGSNTYYLQKDGKWSRSNRVLWKFDGNASGKIYSDNTYLRVEQATGSWPYNTYYYIYSTTDASQASRFAILGGHVKYNNGYLVMSSTGGNAQITTSDNNAASWVQATGSSSATNPAFTPAPYTLKVYGTNGSEVKETAQVQSGADGTIELTGLNNDAIKFSVEGLTGDAKALITFELTLEALNPFINNIDIVCTSMKGDSERLIQQFTSNDFQVSGGEFVFYVPTEFIGDTPRCKFSFENLFSKYGDETYGNGTDRHARNYFVKSKYYNDFGDGRQYSATGNEMPDYPKITTEECGDKAFKYSNIEDLNNTSGSTTSTTLQEYPYSQALYVSQGGTFTNNIEIAVDGEKKCYLFTGDETRWNIAPTTAWEHRYYAYYLMDITLTVKDYDAKCTLTKLYDATCYSEEGADAEKPMYGGVFKAYDKATGVEIPSTKAYLTVNMMSQALANALTEASATAKQILYLDYTNLYSVQTVNAAGMAEMKNKLSPNALIYFPERSSYNEDNYVQKTKSGSYRACKNIVITDKQPFYAPYKITVPAENYATYTRQVTLPKNGKVASATVMLPFTLELHAGVHTNRDGLCSFSVNKMTAQNALSMQDNGTTTEFTGYFTPVTESHTEANVPYMVAITKAPEDENISFIATQYGSDVSATRTLRNNDYTYTGESATGMVGNSSYNFQNYASYSGKKLPKTDQLFYFSGNMFVNSMKLDENRPNVYVYPFRGYYKYTTSSGAKGIEGFYVEYGENNETTGITDMTQKADLMVSVGNGSITLSAAVDTKVMITAVSGVCVDRLSLKAGEMRTLSVPAGLYVINGVKIIVK